MLNMAVRWSGVLLIVGVVLLGAAALTVSFSPANPAKQLLSPRTNLLLFISSILVILSLPGMYARQAEASGGLGLAGHLLLETGMIFVVVYAGAPLLYSSLREAPGESAVAFFLGIALLLGLLLSGIATIRAGVFPRWSGNLMLAATAGFLFSFFVAEFLPPVAGQVGVAFFGVMLALALVGIGFSIWTG